MALLALVLVAASSYLEALQSGTYRYSFAGSFWNGEKHATDATDVLTRDGTSYTIRVAPDGGAEHVALPQERSPFDHVASLLVDAPNARAVGTAWDASVAEQTGDTPDATTAVPLTVRVARDDAAGTLIQASGSAHGLSVSGAYRSPVDLTVRIALLVRDGAVLRCDEDVTDYVHAGPLSQEIRWHWSLVRTE